MKAGIRKYPLVFFFSMAFLLSWIAVIPLLLNPALPVEPFQIAGALAGPTLSALLVTAVIDGRKGLVDFFKGYTRWRAGIGWWLFVLFGILLSLNIVAALILGTSVVTEFTENISLILITYFLNLVAGVLLGPLWEEPGWRGFALPRLQRQFGAFTGTLILGVLWAVWHLPGYLGGWMGEANFLALILSSIAFSLIMTWVYNNTGASILLMILLHSSSNAAISIGSRVLPADLSPGLNSFVYGGWIPAITYLVVAGIVLVLTKGKLSYQPEQMVG